jgi:hypothetical protein
MVGKERIKDSAEDDDADDDADRKAEVMQGLDALTHIGDACAHIPLKGQAGLHAQAECNKNTRVLKAG